MSIMAYAGNGAANMRSLLLKPVKVGNITVSANPQTLALGGTSIIYANVTTTLGTSVPNGTAVNFKTNFGFIEPFAQTTDGIAIAKYTAPAQAGTAKITASFGDISSDLNLTISGP